MVGGGGVKSDEKEEFSDLSYVWHFMPWEDSALRIVGLASRIPRFLKLFSPKSNEPGYGPDIVGGRRNK